MKVSRISRRQARVGTVEHRMRRVKHARASVVAIGSSLFILAGPVTLPIALGSTAATWTIAGICCRSLPTFQSGPGLL